MASLSAPQTMRPGLFECLTRAGEAEFPGTPSQEWRDDFPATQFPPLKTQTAYITPQTSFSAPSNHTETDGFEVQILAACPRNAVGD
jgi:hypothetical protein